MRCARPTGVPLDTKYNGHVGVEANTNSRDIAVPEPMPYHAVSANATLDNNSNQMNVDRDPTGLQPGGTTWAIVGALSMNTAGDDADANANQGWQARVHASRQSVNEKVGHGRKSFSSQAPDTQRWATLAGSISRANHVRVRSSPCMGDAVCTPFVCTSPHQTPRMATGSSCKSYVTIQPDAQGLGHAHANRNTALLVAVALANMSLCYAHPTIKARHVHDQKVWDHWLGFEAGWKSAASLLKDANFQQVHACPVSSLRHPT